MARAILVPLLERPADFRLLTQAEGGRALRDDQLPALQVAEGRASEFARQDTELAPFTLFSIGRPPDLLRIRRLPPASLVSLRWATWAVLPRLAVHPFCKRGVSFVDPS
jgi:hypothetical protein